MKKYIYLITLFAGCLFVLSFKSTRSYRGNLPTSVSVQLYPFSPTTGLPYPMDDPYFSEVVAGDEDSRIFLLKQTDLYDIVNQDFLDSTMINKPLDYGASWGNFEDGNIIPSFPGMVWYGDGMLVDEAEISNIDWHEFLYHIKKDSAISFYKAMLPHRNTEPVPGYYSNPFFRYYPMVSLTHAQAKAYCQWRTEVWNKMLEDFDYKVIVRLPTEQEWMDFATGGVDLKKHPYGVENYKTQLKIKKNSGAYFKIKNNLNQSEEEINEAIKVFNKQKPEVISFHCKQSLPFFLVSKTPNYVYNIPVNTFGLYNIHGNVSEMIEKNEVAMGGNFRKGIEECKLTSKITYYGPSTYVGFRAVCTIVEK